MATGPTGTLTDLSDVEIVMEPPIESFFVLFSPDLHLDPDNIGGTTGNGITWTPTVGTLTDINQTMSDATITTIGVKNAIKFEQGHATLFDPDMKF